MNGEWESDGQLSAAVATVRSLNRPAVYAHDSLDKRQTRPWPVAFRRFTRRTLYFVVTRRPIIIFTSK